jgi:hypothetical protein
MEDAPRRVAGGATENMTVVRSMFADLVRRGLSAEDGLLVVIDGEGAASDVQEVFGDLAGGSAAPFTSGERRGSPTRGSDGVGRRVAREGLRPPQP